MSDLEDSLHPFERQHNNVWTQSLVRKLRADNLQPSRL
jgi:hypothetical protein